MRRQILTVVILGFVLSVSNVGAQQLAATPQMGAPQVPSAGSSQVPAVGAPQTPPVRSVPSIGLPQVPPPRSVPSVPENGRALQFDQGPLDSLISAEGVVLGVPFKPCQEKAAVDVRATLRLPAIRDYVESLHGPLPSIPETQTNSNGEPLINPLSFTPTHDYWVELKAEFLNGSAVGYSKTVSASVPLLDFYRGDLAEEKAVLALPWDGLFGRGIAQGTVNIRGTVTLKMKRVVENGIIQNKATLPEQVMDTRSFTGRVEVESADAACRAWAQLGPTLKKNSPQARNPLGKTPAPPRGVTVHGQDTGLQPWINWRDGLPIMVFGNMAVPPVSTNPATKINYLDMVKTFLKANPQLFSKPGVALPTYQLNVDRLAIETRNGIPLINKDPNETTRIVLRQYVMVDKNITVGSRVATNAAKQKMMVEDSKLNAVFDKTGMLVFVSGQFKTDIPAVVPKAVKTLEQAKQSIVADLSTTGFNSTGRRMDLIEEVVYGAPTSGYQVGYKVEVGEGPTAEAADKRIQAFTYVVSGKDGKKLKVTGNTSHAVTVQGVYEKTNKPLDAGCRVSSILLGQLDRCVGEPTEEVSGSFTLNDPDDGVYVLSNDKSGGVISEVVDEQSGDEFEWDQPQLTFSAGQRTKQLKAMNAFYYINLYWDKWAQFFLPDDSDDYDVDLYIDNNCAFERFFAGNFGGSGSFSAYANPYTLGDSSLNFCSSMTSADFKSTAPHEMHHILDHFTASISFDYGKTNMPTSIEETSGNFFGNALSVGPPTKDISMVIGSLYCVWKSGDFTKCVKPFLIYRDFGASGRTITTMGTATACTNITNPNDYDARDACIANHGGGNTGVLFDLDQDRIADFTYFFIRKDNDCRLAKSSRRMECIRQPDDPLGTYSWPQEEQFNSEDGYTFLLWPLDTLWTTGANLNLEDTVAKADKFANDFPLMYMGAYMLLDQKPSFIDLKYAIRASLSMQPGINIDKSLQALDDAFDRSGIDATIEQYCSNSDTAEYCH